MGRKKRKIDDSSAVEVGDAADEDTTTNNKEVVELKADNTATLAPSSLDQQPSSERITTTSSSGYAMTSHSGDMVQEDIYVSDGTESDSSADMEVVLSSSRMGVMRKGLLLQMHQPNRQWVRSTNDEDAADHDESQAEDVDEEALLATLDPAVRAARLLQEKQRKLDAAKEQARRLESEENAGRDPTLFSKRTAFDIRFDQMEDKPWTRSGDMSDYFNYDLTEQQFLEYAQQQILVRQELIDAARQKRPADPNLVPVTPRIPSAQHPRTTATNAEDIEVGNRQEETEGVEIGPVGPQQAESSEPSVRPKRSEDPADYDVAVGAGGIWGAGAPPALLKMIEDQSELGTADSSHGEHLSDRYPAMQSNSFEVVAPYDNESTAYPPDTSGSWQERPSMPPPPPMQPPPSAYPGGASYRGRGRGYRGRGGGTWAGRGGDFPRKRPREDPRWN